MKKNTPTKAKLPKNETTVGTDAPSGYENKMRKVEMKNLVKSVQRNLKK